ncbi:Thrombospondin type-1 domain-containing protein 4 [Oryzias melastigma]|uniref:Thrombospondin type-1 domain-containing protein 4 n=1 Tax=Oryzias melastigma TaxID=30732 RepID=A0A834C6D9_ORYME|nr:Thrombospondin type-1 domain-containing protein 4 [Oryzias melastigma]
MPCGLGQRSREVRCVSNVGDFVPDEECNMNLRPIDMENCDMGACAKSWFYTEWGNKCSAECGMGVRTRGVLCLKNQISSLPLEGCGSERPADSQVCNNGPCENRIEWFTGPWSQCSAECGAGSQQRAVVCLMKSEEGSLRHAAVRVLIPEPAARPAELQPEGLWSQVVPHGLERLLKDV